jgi:hypothetical protein
MTTDARDADADAQLRVRQAQAMLDLYEADRRRAAVTLEELKEWANAQDQEHLQSRVDRYLEYESEVRRVGCRVRPVSPSIISVLEPRTNGALVQRERDGPGFALEAEIAIVIRGGGNGSDRISAFADQGSRRTWWRRWVGWPQQL